MWQRGRWLVGSTLLLALWALSGPESCLAAGGTDPASLQDAQQRQRQQPTDDSSSGGAARRAPLQVEQQGQQGEPDMTVEESILETYAPVKQPVEGREQAAGSRPGSLGRAPRAQQQQQQQQRRQQLQARPVLQAQQQDQAAQAAEQQRLREHQKRLQEQAAAARQAKAAQDGQAAALGRQSLRSRKQQQQPARQPAVSGSRKGDIFAEHTEKALAAVRQRLAQQQQQRQQQALQVARVAGGDGGAGQEPGARPQQQQQEQEPQQQRGVEGGGKQQPQRQRVPLLLIIVMTLVMAAAAGLGALPFFFMRSMSARTTGLATAVASGVMLAASFDLVHEGQPYGAVLTVVGVLLGGAFIRWVQQHLEAYEDIQFGSLQGSSARKTVLMVGIMAAHALGEGCAVGVSFCGDRGWAQGVLTTLAIGVHNIPEGLAKATVLVGQGVSPSRALAWSIATCLPQPLVAVPSFIFVDAFMMILPVALGFAAGCMIWMVFAELLPDALEVTDGSQVATAATMAAAGLEGFRMLFASMEQPDGTIGCGTTLGHAAAVLYHMGHPLLLLLPAVAAAAAGGAGVGGSAIPTPVAWGVAAAVAASCGGGALIDQLLWRPQVPIVHTAAAAAVGSALAVLLHRQLLNWAINAAAAGAGRPGKNGAANGNGNAMAAQHSLPDVEALAQCGMQQHEHLQDLQLQRQHQLQHHHEFPLTAKGGGGGGEVADMYVDGSGAMNGYGASSSSLQYHAPYHRSTSSAAAAGGGAAGGANGLPGSSTSSFARPGGGVQLSGGASSPGGGMTPRRTRRATSLPPAPQLAAAATALLALAAAAVAAGWHLACSLLLLGTDGSGAIIPAAALLLAPSLGAAALSRTLLGAPRGGSSSGSGVAAGAWAGGGLAALAAAVAALTAARAPESAHTATVVRSYLYPLGLTDTAEAVAAGAMCVAAFFCFAAGASMKARSARGGLVLGLAGTALLGALRMALCGFTPYCLSIGVLLQGR